MRPAFMLFAVSASVLALAGCGGGGSSETDAATDTGGDRSGRHDHRDHDDDRPTTTAATPTTIAIVVKDGRPQGGIERPTIEKGDKVVVVVRTDAGEEVHLHGYDIEKPVTAGKPVRIPFTANLPGRFELELHHPDALLAVIEVRP